MAIVEDEVRNESEEENEIEVVVEEDDGDTDDDDEDQFLEKKVAEIESHLVDDPYNYDEHIELIQALWSLSELERWQSAFERLQEMSALKAEDWLVRLRSEETIAHSQQARERVANLFQQATLDCYSVPILSEWCTWSMSNGDLIIARAQLDDVLRRAGADPLSGKIFWDAKLEFEKAHLETMNKDDPDYKAQQERVLWCLEEIVSRPLLRGDESWQEMDELATVLRDKEYIDKVKRQHEAATDYLQKLTPFEDKLLTIETPEEKCKVYQAYINTVKDMSREEKYAECDSNGILKVLYDRVTYECLSCEEAYSLLLAYARHTHECSSRATYWRVLDACTRRCPRRHTFWTLKIQQAEHEEKEFDEVKAIFEMAFSKGMESYKQAESLWMTYLEFVRRRTKMDNESEVQRLRWTFQMAWDSLAEAWGEEANDSEVPLYWARLEYKFTKDIKQGKSIFEEIFRYGENKTMSKYWEALIHLEMNRSGISEHKLRDLMRRALRSVRDYPPAIVRLWTDYERDYGTVRTIQECNEACEAKTKEWRDSYQAMKDKIIGKKQKGKQFDKKKPAFDKKKNDFKQNKGKRKADDDTSEQVDDVKKKKCVEETRATDDKKDSSSGVKRPLEEDSTDGAENKRQRTDSSTSDTNPGGGKDACTLFVSNLDSKVSEEDLKEKLSEYGDIVSLRLRTSLKAFGGSICYCQYKSADSVDKALKHDRTTLHGRPMFLSRFSATKSKTMFKYSTGAEKNKLFVKNIPFSHCNREALTEVFDKYGSLKDVRIVTFKDGKPKGLAYIEYNDETSAAEALSKTNGLLVGTKNIEVAVSAPPPKTEQSTSGMNLGQPKRETGGMRRTQLSSFIPSVLQKASTSKATISANGDHHNNGDTNRSLSNNDFRKLLLGSK